MKRIILLFILFIPAALFSCECPAITTITQDACKQYDVIFTGKVDSVAPCGKDGIGTAYFTIKDLFKGSVEQHVAVGYECSSDCLMSFSKNEEWIIYGSFARFDQVLVNLCSNTRKKPAIGEQDFYAVQTGQSFEKEEGFLKTTLGDAPFAKHNALNDQQVEMRPHNDQPTGMNKLWLLLISFSVMLIVYIVSKKYFKNDK